MPAPIPPASCLAAILACSASLSSWYLSLRKRARSSADKLASFAIAFATGGDTPADAFRSSAALPNEKARRSRLPLLFFSSFVPSAVNVLDAVLSKREAEGDDVSAWLVGVLIAALTADAKESFVAGALGLIVIGFERGDAEATRLGASGFETLRIELSTGRARCDEDASGGASCSDATGFEPGMVGAPGTLAFNRS